MREPPYDINWGKHVRSYFSTIMAVGFVTAAGLTLHDDYTPKARTIFTDSVKSARHSSLGGELLTRHYCIVETEQRRAKLRFPAGICRDFRKGATLEFVVEGERVLPGKYYTGISHKPSTTTPSYNSPAPTRANP